MQQLTFVYPYCNPLLERLGAKFFKTVPTSPGVYLMKRTSGEVLYVGKAKNLRNRLNSYKNARPTTVSRKVLRMLRLVQVVELRECCNEKDALLNENNLLRELRPPFNVVNTYPELYYFIQLSKIDVKADTDGYLRIELQLTSNPKERESAARTLTFGVFKGRGRTRDAFQALCRLLCALSARDETFSFPAALARRGSQRPYRVRVPKELVSSLGSFLSGRSRGFLEELVTIFLEMDTLPRFVHHVIEEDLKLLDCFYDYGPRRVSRLKKLGGIRRRPIAQDEIDDLLVIYGWHKRCKQDRGRS